MLARVVQTFRPSAVQRLDRWWLQRAPMLWRARLVTALLLLVLLVSISVLLFPETIFGFDSLRVIHGSYARDTWPMQVVGAVLALGVWVRLILRRPVGELPARRHVVTLLAVTVGSYLWLVAPSMLALGEIKAIAKLEVSAEQLERDRAVLARYSNWQCVPMGKGRTELEQLKAIYARYDHPRYGPLKLQPIPPTRACDDPSQPQRSLDPANTMQIPSFVIGSIEKKLDVILDAKSFSLWSGPVSENQFSHIRASFRWSFVAALGAGALAVLLSYPGYVWRRTLLRR